MEHFSTKKKQKIVATDTKAIIAVSAEFDFDGIIPKKSFNISIKTTTKANPLAVSFKERKLDKTEESYLTTGRLLEIVSNEIVIGIPEIRGTFPDWESVILPIKDIESLYDFTEGEATYRKGLNNEDILIPKATRIKTNAHLLDFEIAKMGVIINSKYTKPLIDYMQGIKDSEITVYMIATDKPIHIEHKMVSLVIMPTVRCYK